MHLHARAALLLALTPALACRMLYISGEQGESSISSTSFDPPDLTSASVSTSGGFDGASSGGVTASASSGVGHNEGSSDSEPTSSTTPPATASDETGSHDTATSGAACGDGDVTGDEECDGGPGCNEDCRDSCGDGDIDPGETCDSQPPHCAMGACTLCGDGILNGTPGAEECDDASPDIAGTIDACSDECRKTALLAFISSTSHKGDFSNSDAEFPFGVYDTPLSGIDNADMICLNLVKNAQIGGLPWAVRPATAENHSFKAWLSDYFSSPSSEKGFTKCNLPYFMPSITESKKIDFVMIGKSFNQITTDNQLLTPLNRNESGSQVQSKRTWTNTKSDGTTFTVKLASNCSNWSETYFLQDYHGYYGNATDSLAPPSRWTIDLDADPKKCSDNHRIYCFEQCPP